LEPNGTEYYYFKEIGTEYYDVLLTCLIYGKFFLPEYAWKYSYILFIGRKNKVHFPFLSSWHQ